MTPALGLFEWQRLIRGLNLPAPVNNVAAWVSTYANTDGTSAHPGVGELMLASGLSRGTVVQALAALRDAGLLRRVKRGGGQGSRYSDEYELSVPEGEPTVEALEKLVADAYESARWTRKPEGPTRKKSARRTRKAERPDQNEFDPHQYESAGRTYESAGRTPPPLDHPSDPPRLNSNTSSAAVTVEGDQGPSSRDRFGDEKIRQLAARQAADSRSARATAS